MYVNDCHDSWVQWLPMCTYAYNTGVHTSTHFTPMELMMGRVGRTPSDLLLAAKDSGPVALYHAAYLRHLRKIRDVARAALSKAQERMKAQYDKRFRLTMTLREGMFVWIKHIPRGKGISKLKHTWKGPAKIIENAGYDNWVVECGWNRNARMLVHSSACVRYHEDERLMQMILQDGLDELDANPMYETDDRAGPAESPVLASGLPVPGMQEGERRSSRVAGQLRQEQDALDANEAQALLELDDCGIRRR